MRNSHFPFRSIYKHVGILLLKFISKNQMISFSECKLRCIEIFEYYEVDLSI